MINFARIKSRVAAVEAEVKNGGDLAKMYAENLEKINKCNPDEDDEEYETLREIEWYLIMKIVEVYMDQNGYYKDREGNYERK